MQEISNQQGELKQSKYFALKLADSVTGEESFHVTEKMQEDAPHFDTEAEASSYADLINPDALWVIGPLGEEEVGKVTE